MPVISRATLPAEFFDRTSAMMLVQPEPQYLYSQFVFMADLQAELKMNPDAFSLLAGRGIDASFDGAAVKPFSENQLQLVIADKVHAEAIAVSSELAKGNVGHTIRMNRPVFANSTYTAASRLISTGSTISTTPISLTAEQVSITIQRFAGPYDQANSRVAPYAIDRFDAQRSVHDLVATVGVQLQRDRMRFVDSIYASIFDSPVTSNIIFPGDPTNALAGSDASAFPSATNGYRPMDVETIFRAEQKMADNFIPRFSNGKYMLVLTPQQARQLRTDPAFQRMSVFQPENSPLKQSYVGDLGLVEIYACSTNTVDTTTVASVSINHGIMFGPGYVGRVKDGEGCRVVDSTDDNYGETPKVVWLAYEGQSLLDNRFVVGLHSN